MKIRNKRIAEYYKKFRLVLVGVISFGFLAFLSLPMTGCGEKLYACESGDPKTVEKFTNDCCYKQICYLDSSGLLICGDRQICGTKICKQCPEGGELFDCKEIPPNCDKDIITKPK